MQSTVPLSVSCYICNICCMCVNISEDSYTFKRSNI